MTADGKAGAWLVRGKRPDCAELASLGPSAAFLSNRAERLQGGFEVSWRGHDDFYIPVELDSESGQTAVHGQFRAYTTLWSPLVGPAMLLGFGGPRTTKR